MPRANRKPRTAGPRPSARRQPGGRTAPAAAARTWVVPTIAVTGAFAAFVSFSVGIVEQPLAVTIVGAAGLLLVLFFGLRGFLETEPDGPLVAALAVFVLLWLAAAGYPFYRAVNPGAPAFSATLTRDAPPVMLPLQDKPGRYTVVVEGHFLPTGENVNRTATYVVQLARAGQPTRLLQGTFSEEWGTQRIGSGRRSSLVQVLHETTEQVDTLDVERGAMLTAQLTSLSAGVRDSVTLRLYTESVPRPLFAALAVLALAAAVQLDSWRPKGESESLLATLTVATLLSIIVFRNSSVAAPGFAQLVVAALVGTLGGAVAMSIFWRLTRPLRRYLPARP